MKTNAAICALLTCTLVACGGGGDDGTADTTATATYPVEAAFRTFFGTAANYQASASDRLGNTYALTFSVSPQQAKSAPSISASTLPTTLVTASVRINNGSPVVDTSEIYYAASPFTLVGSIADGEVFRTTRSDPLPATAAVGATGLVASGTLTDGATTTTEIVNWSLESDTASTAWLCMQTQGTDADGPYSSKECIRINQAGVISGFRSDVTASGLTLQFR
jgi:hypothetical protein